MNVLKACAFFIMVAICLVQPLLQGPDNHPLVYLALAALLFRAAFEWLGDDKETDNDPETTTRH